MIYKECKQQTIYIITVYEKDISDSWEELESAEWIITVIRLVKYTFGCSFGK